MQTDFTPDAQPAQAPPTPAQPQVNVSALAQQAVTQMQLEAPVLSSSPNNPDTLGSVGLPVWFWVSHRGPTTVGPSSATATAGAVSVTANATFTGQTRTAPSPST